MICNFCGNASFLTLHRGIIDDVSGESFDVLKCENCNLLFTYPVPTKEAIKNYYPQKYYHYTGKDRYLSARVAFLIKEYHVKPPENFIRRTISRILSKLFSRFVAIVIEGPGNNKNVLDVGCGDGRSFSWLGNYGYNVYGNEISSEDCKLAEARGMKVFNGTLEEADYPDEFFDIIIFSQVFEHLHNPSETLRECRRILKKDGLLIIDVPNIDDVPHKIYGKFWFALEVPRHLYHFSRETLSAYLFQNDFNILLWRYRYPKFFDLASIKRILRYGNILLLLKTIFFSILNMLKYPFTRNRDLVYSQTIAVYATKR